MSTTFTVRHTFDVDPETFWEKIFFDDAFNVDLYVRDLGFARWDVVEPWHEEADGTKVRKVLTEPKSDAPKAVKKVIGDSLTYVEAGRFDPKTHHYKFDIVPSKMADKTRIVGDFWVEPRGEGKCERICRHDVDVRIFGVGKIVEAFITSSTKDSFDQAAEATRRFIRDRKL